MQGGATQAMPRSIVEERQRRRRPHAAGTRRAPGGCGRSLRCSSSPMRTGIASSSRLDLASQAPGARLMLILGRAPSVAGSGVAATISSSQVRRVCRLIHQTVRCAGPRNSSRSVMLSQHPALSCCRGRRSNQLAITNSIGFTHPRSTIIRLLGRNTRYD